MLGIVANQLRRSFNQESKQHSTVVFGELDQSGLGYQTAQLDQLVGALATVHLPGSLIMPRQFCEPTVGIDVRAEDRASLHGVRDALWKAVGRVDGIVERGQAADQQFRRLIWSSVGAAMVGMILMAILPGAIARSLPESWHVPEWMAARVLRMEQREAGTRMMETVRNEPKAQDDQTSKVR